MTRSRQTSKQSGGTFVGIVLGLILGLAIAVVIALYITRSPTPFLSERKPPPFIDAGNDRPPAGSNHEPQNKPLNQAAPNVTPEQPPSYLPGEVNGPRIIEIPPSPETTTGTPSQSVPPTRADETGIGYYLQIGAYKTLEDAEQQRARLALQGFEAKVSQRNSGRIIYYRIRLGPFAKFEDMKNERQQLSDAGIDAIVIRFKKTTP